jgi:hypothetical protein
VMFTDECQIQLNWANGHKCVWQRK